MDRTPSGRAPSRWARRIVWTLLALLVVVPTLAFSTVAVALAPSLPPTIAAVSAAVWTLGAAAVFLLVRPTRRALFVWIAAFGVFVAWWSTIEPRTDGDWEPDVSRPPRAEFDGDLVTVRDVRNFEWTSATGGNPRWEDRTYDLSKIDSGWFIVSYWEGHRAVAHTMLSFGFDDGRYLALSVESRRERGETYTPFRGLFKQYELCYVLADERDVFRVRTDHRHEDLYLYPMAGATRDGLKSVLTSILRGADDLAREPQWYMTVGRNCTTSLVRHLDAGAAAPIPWHRWRLLNGYSDEFAYERGHIPCDRPFEEVRAAHRVTDIARALGDDPEFSRKLRAALGGR